MVGLAKALATNTTVTRIDINREWASGLKGGGGRAWAGGGWKHLMGCMVVWSRVEGEVGAYSKGEKGRWDAARVGQGPAVCVCTRWG